MDPGQAVDAFDFTADGLWLARPTGLELYHYTADGLALDRRVDAAHGWPSINVVDLANRYSCAFIGTEDIGKLHADGRFEVLGRLDNSALRGCSLMVS